MVLLVVQLSLLIAPLNSTYPEVVPWECEDIVPIYCSQESNSNYERRLGVLATDALIGLYRRKVAPHSIARCPFYISCSNYAQQAIRRYGLGIGLCYFIDRHFYREHIFAYRLYEMREAAEGVLKLDDSYYLYGRASTMLDGGYRH
jgi:putative component of membrane protein insertase Oxa1/YidC/SpoIIIJ protein YidD